MPDFDNPRSRATTHDVDNTEAPNPGGLPYPPQSLLPPEPPTARVGPHADAVRSATQTTNPEHSPNTQTGHSTLTVRAWVRAARAPLPPYGPASYDTFTTTHWSPRIGAPDSWAPWTRVQGDSNTITYYAWNDYGQPPARLLFQRAMFYSAAAELAVFLATALHLGLQLSWRLVSGGALCISLLLLGQTATTLHRRFPGGPPEQDPPISPVLNPAQAARAYAYLVALTFATCIWAGQARTSTSLNCALVLLAILQLASALAGYQTLSYLPTP